jgi:hypothetical protein
MLPWWVRSANVGTADDSEGWRAFRPWRTLVRSVMRTVAIASACVAVAMFALSLRVMADGLALCNHFDDGFLDELDGHIDAPHAGDTVVSFTAIPSFQAEWGLRIIQTADGFLLRSTQFRRSIWYDAYREVRPGRFERVPELKQPDPIVHEVSLSPGFGAQLRDLIVEEIDHADSADARMGLDGESFYYSANGHCGFTWSPERGTRPARLVDLFENLKVQASLPTRLLQLFWEKRVLAKISTMIGRSQMPVSEYLVVIGLGLAVIAFAALPLFIAAVVMLIPHRLRRKGRFVLVSGAMSYGFTCLVALVFLPFFLAGSQVSAQLEVDGHTTSATATDLIVRFGLGVMIVCWLMFSVAVPVYMRRTVWPAMTRVIPVPSPVVPITPTKHTSKIEKAAPSSVGE